MKNPIEILITGDFYGGKETEKLIKENKYDQIFNDFLPLIRQSNIAITNLEAPLIEKGNTIIKTGPALKAIPETIEALKYAGFDLLTLANNHIMDYGEEGLMKTLKISSENGIVTIGAGENSKKASQTYFKSINDIRIAFINFTENEWSTTKGEKPGAHALDPIRNFYEIQEAKKNADFVLLIIHGGVVNYNLPSPRMKKLYRYFIDIGADAVVGHHSHFYSGYELYKEKPIFYSLGNFVFESSLPRSNLWYIGYVIKLILDDKNSKLKFLVIPYTQNYNNKIGINKLDEEEKIDFDRSLKKLNQIIADDSLLMEKFQNEIGRLSNQYLNYLEPHSFRIVYGLQKRHILPRFISKKKLKYYLNLIRCEAHHEALMEVLNRKVS